MTDELATEKQVKFMRNLGVNVHDGMTKQQAKVAIDDALQQRDSKPEVVKVPGQEGFIKQASNGNGSMYASYAKDIFCEMVKKEFDQERYEEGLMNEAIKLVKQAKEAFE